MSKWTVFFLIFFITNSLASEPPEHRSWGQILWGEVFETLNVDIGSYTMHFHTPKEYKKYYPTVNVNYLGLAVMYFRNSHDDDTYGIGIERYWKEWDIFRGKSYFGYRFGGIYGYCRTSWTFAGFYSRCHPKKGETFGPDYNPKPGVQPMGQLFLQYRNHGLGVVLATAVAITTVSVLFYFD